MTYASIVEMTQSVALRDRIAAAAAEEGQPGDAMAWALENIWQVVASGNWDAAWDSANASATVNDNPDTGARDDVITDAMILSAVQPMIGGA